MIKGGGRERRTEGGNDGGREREGERHGGSRDRLEVLHAALVRLPRRGELRLRLQNRMMSNTVSLMMAQRELKPNPIPGHTPKRVGAGPPLPSDLRLLALPLNDHHALPA